MYLPSVPFLPINTQWEREGLRVGFEVSQSAEELIQLREPMVPTSPNPTNSQPTSRNPPPEVLLALSATIISPVYHSQPNSLAAR